MISLSNVQKKGIFERTISTRNGNLVRVRFEIYEINGEIKGRVIGWEFIRNDRLIAGSRCSEGTGDIRCLPFSCQRNEHESQSISYKTRVVSPYTELYFFMSQPTRAPAKVNEEL